MKGLQHSGVVRSHNASVLLQRGLPTSKAPVASQRGERKRAKVSPAEYAVLLPWQNSVASKASAVTSGNETDSSKHTLLDSIQAQHADSSKSYDSGLHCEIMPQVKPVPLQKYVLQAKGLAPHVVCAVPLQQELRTDWNATALTAVDQPSRAQLLASVFQQAIVAAQQCTANGLSVVAVEVQLMRHINNCYIICYQL